MDPSDFCKTMLKNFGTLDCNYNIARRKIKLENFRQRFLTRGLQTFSNNNGSNILLCTIFILWSASLKSWKPLTFFLEILVQFFLFTQQHPKRNFDGKLNSFSHPYSFISIYTFCLSLSLFLLFYVSQSSFSLFLHFSTFIFLLLSLSPPPYSPFLTLSLALRKK